mmetsp:Transcript_3443/g.7723  ORF Transcript_3443/g.7723 Transcript_3443/m.7723 type:complete len:96 (+) Transcript_3443:2200-2487(+)
MGKLHASPLSSNLVAASCAKQPLPAAHRASTATTPALRNLIVHKRLSLQQQRRAQTSLSLCRSPSASLRFVESRLRRTARHRDSDSGEDSRPPSS